jgi:hypothetical protein
MDEQVKRQERAKAEDLAYRIAGAEASIQNTGMMFGDERDRWNIQMENELANQANAQGNQNSGLFMSLIGNVLGNVGGNKSGASASSQAEAALASKRGGGEFSSAYTSLNNRPISDFGSSIYKYGK